MGPGDTELPIIRAMYDLTLWLSRHIAKFPRSHRFVLGERMERQLHGLLEAFLRARYAKARARLLEEANIELEILRFQVRLAKDMRCLSVKAYGGAAERITAIGRQLGGWRKKATE